MRDLLLTCEVAFADRNGRFHASIRDSDGELEIQLARSDRRWRLLRNGTELASEPLRDPSQDSSTAIEYALCDRQILLAIDGETVVRYQLREAAAKSRHVTKPLAIGASRGAIRLRGLRVFRDRYYLPPLWEAERDGGFAAKIPIGNWFLMGDNPAISVDSRDWAGIGVKTSDIVGAVYPLRSGTDRFLLRD